MQQRGIKPDTIELLLLCGAKEHDHRGAAILYFDKQARQSVLTRYGAEKYSRIERQLDTYVVICENGGIITVGHRTKRINRH
jgi:hypothetical protein